MMRETQRQILRIFIIILFVLSKQTLIFAQTKSNETELIIIGTKHSGNKTFNDRTLYNILVKINPEIILWEQSVKFKRVFGLRTANFLRIWKPGIEQLALQKYSRINKSIQILPFDTTITSRKQYIKNLAVVRYSFYNELNAAKKSSSDSVFYADFAYKSNLFYSFIDTSTLGRINQGDIVDLSQELHNLEEQMILPLGRKYIADSSIVDKFADEIQFWNYRNEHMVNQIVHYSKQFAGKRIVILTGLNHKFYLQYKLSENKENNLKIIEFVDE